MANNGSSVTPAAAAIVTLGQVAKTANSASTANFTKTAASAANASSGKTLPGGTLAASGATAHRLSQPAPIVSDRPTKFRVDPASQGRTIQQINPDTGEIIAEFASSEFPALARSLGVPGVFVDSHA